MSADWQEIKLEDALDYVQPTNFIVKSTDYNDSYETPVLTPGKSFLLGFTDEADGIYQNIPTIIFDDFTTQFKYVDFPFKVKSSAMKMLELKSDEYDIKFLYYLMQTLNFTASEHKRYWISKYSKQKVNVPSLAEQKQIAAILDAADSLRQKDQKLIEHYTALSQSLFLEMFGDPITNSMGWNLVKLGRVCGVGSSKRVFVNEFVETGVPFYRGTEVGQLGDGQKIKPHLFISDQHYVQLKEKSGVPQVGDLLLPSICHDGRIWRVTTEKPFYFKDGRVLWIKVNSDSINSEYLRHFLKSLFLTNYSNFASGTTFAELKIVALKGMSILNPPVKLQNQFAERVAIIEQQKQQAQANLKKSEALFNSLLQRAFTGELTANKAA